VAGIPAELIFVLVVVVFSVLDGVGRKKKAKREGAPGPVPGPQRRSVQNPETVATPPSEPANSEGMIPGDVWEEILGLARGTAPEPERVEEPVQAQVEESSWTAYLTEGQTPERTPDFQAPELESLVPRREGVRSMPDRSRAPSVPAQPSGEKGAWGKRAEAKRSLMRHYLFGDGSVAELRKAIILKEVLGPPVSMKE